MRVTGKAATQIENATLRGLIMDMSKCLQVGMWRKLTVWETPLKELSSFMDYLQKYSESLTAAATRTEVSICTTVVLRCLRLFQDCLVKN
jgi:hypothetical protein